MVINKTIYTMGDIDINGVISLIKSGKGGWDYFVYTASGLPVIGDFQVMRSEKEEVVILGVASSRRLARRLVLHIIVKALELDNDIAGGISKMIDI